MNKKIDFENLTPEDYDIIAQRLLAPFNPKHYTFKPGSGNSTSKTPLIALDPRLVSTRLNQVFGVGNWSTSHSVGVDYSAPGTKVNSYDNSSKEDVQIATHVSCSISIHRGQFKATQSNIGDHSEWLSHGNHFTSPWAQAFKRAAVNFGIGAFLYEIKLPKLSYSTAKGFDLDPAAIRALLDEKDVATKALEAVGFNFLCEQSGVKVTWLEAAMSMERFGGVLSPSYVQEVQGKK